MWHILLDLKKCYKIVKIIVKAIIFLIDRVKTLKITLKTKALQVMIEKNQTI